MNPTLAAALSTLLPSTDHTLLLRACLLSGDDARTAWHHFSARVPDLPSLFRTDFGRLKRLSPLLLHAVQRNELPADPGLLTVLRTAYLREELRARAYQEILGSALRELRAADVAFVVLKGAALSETVYPGPVLRHSHDIDFLMRPNGRERVAVALSNAGFEPLTEYGVSPTQELLYRHPSALLTRVHTRLFRLDCHSVDLEGLLDRRCEIRVAGQLVHVLSPADSLLHALGHASYCPSRATLLWVCDAWMILHAAPDLDWDLFVEQARLSRLAIPLSRMVGYLATDLDAPVPEHALGKMRTNARSAGRFERDLALSAARQSLGPEARGMLGAVRGAREKLRLAAWILFPSPDYIRWAHGVERYSGVALAYLARPASIPARRLSSRFRRVTDSES